MNGDENHDQWLNLSLSPPPIPEPQRQPSVSVPIQEQELNQPNHQVMFFRVSQHSEDPHELSASVSISSRQYNHNNQDEAGPSRQPRASRRRLPLQRLGEGKSPDIPPPYDWATSRRAHVYSLDELLLKGINVINGEVQCKLCGNVFSMEFDLHSKFSEVVEYIRRNKWYMHQRAPTVWMNPALPNCQAPQCGKRNCAKPVINKKRSTNWLFLLLGQMLGCCKLEHLKYFCKHTRNHRTGAKDRVLYLTYISLCRQLDPAGPFDG